MYKILIVDDEQDIRASLKRLLARGDYRDVYEASDGIEALEVFKNELPDLVITDVNMPKGNGIDLVKNIRKLSGSEFTPVVFLSAKTSMKNQQEGFESGCDNYFCKPIDRSSRPVFLAMIKSLLERSNKRRNSLTETAKCRLTDLPRREAFIEALKKELALLNRNGGFLSIAIIDIDHFKEVNDTHGHIVGDKILQQLSAIMKKALRQSDYIYRYGGEEFTILFPSISSEGVGRALERLRGLCQEFNWENDLKITFSGGVLELRDSAVEEDFENYIVQTDKALYEAKNTGRNKTVVKVFQQIRRAI